MEHRERLLDPGPVLDAAQASSPVEAVEAVTRELGRAIGATSVSLLIADFSGRALVRLAHVPFGQSTNEVLRRGARREEDELATVLHFDGGAPEQAVRTQTVQVLPPGHPPAAGAGSRVGGSSPP